MRVGVRLTRLGPVQLLRMDRLQPRHELEAQQPAERKGYRALTMRIDVLAINFHFRAMSDDSLDHRRYLGGGGRLELRVDAQRFPLDMPVDHDAPTAVADVPLGRKVLVPRTEVLGVGRAGGGTIAPDRGVAGMQRAIGDDSDGPAHRVNTDVSPSH